MHEIEPPRVFSLHLLLASVPKLGFRQPLRLQKLWRDTKTRARTHEFARDDGQHRNRGRKTLGGVMKHRCLFALSLDNKM